MKLIKRKQRKKELELSGEAAPKPITIEDKKISHGTIDYLNEDVLFELQNKNKNDEF